MSLMGSAIKDIDKMLVQFENGEIKPADIKLKLNMYKEKHKWVKLATDVIIASKKPKLIEKMISGHNILTIGEQLQSKEDIEKELIQCPDQNSRMISRGSCLDYSGDSKNLSTCKSCVNFAVTRKLVF